MTTAAATSRLHRLVDWALGDDVLAGADVGHAVLVVTDTLAAILGAATEPEVVHALADGGTPRELGERLRAAAAEGAS